MALIPTTQVNVSPDDYKRKIAYALMQQGMDTSPVQAWSQGAARALQGALGGYEMYQDDQKQKADAKDSLDTAYEYQYGGQPTPQAAPPIAAPQEPPTPPPPGTPMAGAATAAALGGQPPMRMASNDPTAATGPRPGGPVMPSGKVWGDQEAENAGLYEPSKPKAAMALANPSAPMQPTPVQSVPVAPPVSPVAAALGPKPAVVADEEGSVDPVRAKIDALRAKGTPAALGLAKSILENQITQGIKPDDKTDHITDYKFYSKQEKAAGREPSTFQDWTVAQKKAGAQNISIDQKGENAFSTKAGQLQAERYDGLAADAQGSKQMLSDVQTLTQLGKTIQTGKLAEAKAAIGPYAQALGVDVKGLSEIQAFEAIVNRVAPSLRVKGSGAQSDFELKNFLKSLPSLGNTEEGNAIASKTMEGLYQNKLTAAEIGSKALSREITPAQADKMLRELPDHMEGYREYLKKNKAGSGATTINGYTIRER